MLGIISKFLSPAMPYLLGGAIVAGLVLSGMLYFKGRQYDRLLAESAGKIERAESNARQMEQVAKDQQAEISRLLTAQAEQKARDEQRARQIALAQKSLDEERRKNDSYRSRWAKVANEKPGLLANRINRAADERMRRIAAATCRADCDKDGDQKNSGKTAAEARADSPQ